MLGQKTFKDRVIGGKVIKNTGQLPQVLIQNNHPGIVSRETFYAVQEEMKRRGAAKSPSAKSPTGRTSYTSRYALSERLVCGECGTLYRRCTWNIRGQKKIMWRCVSRLDYGKKYCHNSPSMEEGPLQQAILNAINFRMSPKEELAEQIADAMRLEIAPSGGAASLGQIKNNIEVLTKEFDRLLEQNTMDSESERRFAEIARQLTKLRKQQEAASSNLRSNAAERARANAIEKTLDQAEHRITQWSEEVIRQIVHTVRVISVDQIQVILYDGTQIDQQV